METFGPVGEWEESGVSRDITKWLELYYKQIDRTQDAWDREQELMLTVMAGEPMTLFGKPVEITIKFPEGRLPLGKTSMEEFRAEMRGWLTAHRKRVAERQSRRAA